MEENEVMRGAKILEAQSILLKNRRDGFTVPTEGLYPFQWNWDSAFIALGYSHFEVKYALQEFDTLLTAQWENGMIPQIVFHSRNETSYFPNFDFWNSNVNPGAPSDIATSGISQPPVHGFLLEKIFQQHAGNEDVVSFVKTVFPKLVNSHRFFYQYRDPEKEGLFFTYHPWESGRDNSPVWDHVLEAIQLAPGQVPAYERKDTLHADAAERPTTFQYDRFVYLLELGKSFGYDGPEIARESPLVIQDCLMNAVLIASNAALIRMGKDLQLDVKELEEWQSQSVARFKTKLWNDDLGAFAGYDVVQQKQIPFIENGSFVPLLAEIPDMHQSKQIVAHLEKWQKQGFRLCPSFNPEHALFDPKRYWRGPIWPHMNWMIIAGLRKYGFSEMAESIKNDTIQLIEQHGFYEYYDARPEIKNPAYGGNNFSWTASTYLDLMSE